MLDGLETRLRRLFSTTGGKSLLEGLEREATQTENALDARRAAAARVEGARRRQHEEEPALEAAIAMADEALKEARRCLDEAHRARYETGMALRRHRDRVLDDIRRGEGELRRTADPRILAAYARVHEACAEWHHTARRLLRIVVHGEFMNSYRVAENEAEVNALERRLEDCHAALERLTLVAAPAEEEITAAVREADAAVGAVTLPDGGGR